MFLKVEFVGARLIIVCVCCNKNKAQPANLLRAGSVPGRMSKDSTYNTKSSNSL